MMAEFVAKCAEESSERRRFFPDCSSHPDPSQHGIGIVISEEFGRPMLADLNGRAARTRTPHFWTW